MQKYDKRKVTLCFFAVRRGADPYKIKPEYRKQSKDKIKSYIRFFFCICRRKRKSYQKENAEKKFRALRSATVAADGSRKPLKRLDLNFNRRAKTLLWVCENIVVRAKTQEESAAIPHFSAIFSKSRVFLHNENE